MGDRLSGSSILPEAQPPQSGISYSSPPSQHLQPQVSCPQAQTDQTQQQQLSVVSHVENRTWSCVLKRIGWFPCSTCFSELRILWSDNENPHSLPTHDHGQLCCLGLGGQGLYLCTIHVPPELHVFALYLFTFFFASFSPHVLLFSLWCIRFNPRCKLSSLKLFLLCPAASLFQWHLHRYMFYSMS